MSTVETWPILRLLDWTTKYLEQKGLEAARSTVDNAVRSARYGNFLAAWTGDLPAVVLYEPEYVYGVNPLVGGIIRGWRDRRSHED